MKKLQKNIYKTIKKWKKNEKIMKIAKVPVQNILGWAVHGPEIFFEPVAKNHAPDI